MDLVIGLTAAAFVAVVIYIGNKRRAAREREKREASQPLRLHDNDRSGSSS